MDPYLQALDLLLRASELMEDRGETALVAHLAMPVALLSDRVRVASARSHAACCAH